LASKKALACSDGSYDPQYGTGIHGWVFSTDQKEILLQSAGPTDGHPKLNSPYKSEISGLLAVLYITRKICLFHDIMEGSLLVLCNNKGALCNIFSKTCTGISPFLYTDFDLIRESQSLLVYMPVKIKSEWVKGHSTNKTKTIQEHLNTLAEHYSRRC
jgi:hypothetical protein